MNKTYCERCERLTQTFGEFYCTNCYHIKHYTTIDLDKAAIAPDLKKKIIEANHD